MSETQSSSNVPIASHGRGQLRDLTERNLPQGHLAHKKQPPLLGPPWGPKHSPTVGPQGDAVSHERDTPVFSYGIACRRVNGLAQLCTVRTQVECAYKIKQCNQMAYIISKWQKAIMKKWQNVLFLVAREGARGRFCGSGCVRQSSPPPAGMANPLNP